MSVEIDIAYTGDLRCTATHVRSGNTLTTDAPLDNGGRGEAFSPTDLVATGVGACMMTVMGLVAQRHGIDLTGAKVRVIKEMIAAPVRRIGAIRVTITFPPGRSFSPEDRERLERAAHICPAKHSLHPDVNAVVDFVYGE